MRSWPLAAAQLPVSGDGLIEVSERSLQAVAVEQEMDFVVCGRKVESGPQLSVPHDKAVAVQCSEQCAESALLSVVIGRKGEFNGRFYDQSFQGLTVDLRGDLDEVPKNAIRTVLGWDWIQGLALVFARESRCTRSVKELVLKWIS